MIIPSMRLDGKVALVTGGGSGLGQAMAIGLAHAGAKIIVSELPDKGAAAEETVAQIRSVGGCAVSAALDVTKISMIHATIDLALDQFGRLDILVNNAGINIPKWAVDVSEDDWDKVLDINLKGVFFTAQAAAKKAMIPQGAGKIINIASQNGMVGYYYRAAYCSSKAGVVNLTRVLAIEWATHKINVNAVGPTFIHTPMNKPMFEDEEFHSDVLRRIPLGRIGRPEDVIGAVVFLASPASDLVTGHTLLVDGGWTAI